jgi:hypothetical protein
MTKLRDKQTIAVFLGLVLSTGVLAEAVEGRAANHQSRSTGQSEQDRIQTGSALFDDRVVSAESQHLLKVGDWDRRSDRRRYKEYRGRDYGYRHPGRHGHKRHHYYGYGPRPYHRHHHDYYYDGAEPLLWYGLGVLTPYLLDDRFYY